MKNSKSQDKRIKKYLNRWLQKISLLPKIVKCDNCNRLAISENECLSLEYCRSVGIKFLCGSCRFPQYKNNLRNAVRGNIGKIYGMRFVIRLNRFVPITNTTNGDSQ